MSLRTDLLAQIAALQAQIAILNQAPTDTYSFGTIVVFSNGPSPAQKWYYVKVAEESWRGLSGSDVNTEKDLASWILQAKLASTVYFEVYVVVVSGSPIFASA